MRLFSSVSRHMARVDDGIFMTVAEQSTGALSWSQWQDAVLVQLRRVLGEVLPTICPEDVDWDSWRRYFQGGFAPLSAVNRALERF